MKRKVLLALAMIACMGLTAGFTAHAEEKVDLSFFIWDEEQALDAQNMIDATCAHRMGKPEELGFAIATIADERNGYLCGIDVLIDGGASTGKLFKK